MDRPSERYFSALLPPHLVPLVETSKSFENFCFLLSSDGATRTLQAKEAKSYSVL